LVFYNARGLSVRTTPLGSTPFGNERKECPRDKNLRKIELKRSPNLNIITLENKIVHNCT
jgi:hypothetical protein